MNSQFRESLSGCVASDPTRCSVMTNDISSYSAEPGGESTSCIRSRRPSRRPPTTQPDDSVAASLRRRQPDSDVDRQPPETVPPTGSTELVRRGSWLSSGCPADGRRAMWLDVIDVDVSGATVSAPRCSSASRRLYDPAHSSYTAVGIEHESACPEPEVDSVGCVTTSGSVDIPLVDGSTSA